MPRHKALFRSLILAFLCLLLAQISSAADFTLEQVLSSPFPTGLVAAKASPRIAWVFNAKGVRNVWVADGADFQARQLTRWAADDGQPIASLRITPDGRTVVFARGSEANESGRIADPSNGIAARQHRYGPWMSPVERPGCWG